MKFVFLYALMLVIILTVIYFYMKRKFKYWKNLGVPQIPPTAIIGNIGDLIKKNLGETLKNFYEKSSESYVGFYVFTKPFILIRDPKLIKQILVKDFNYFNDRFVSAASHDIIGSSNLFLVKNPHWKFLRKNLTPIYSSGKLRKLFELIDNVGDDLVNLMESLNLEGDEMEVDVKDLSARYISEAIATAAFGVRANCLSNPEAKFYKMGRKVFANTYMRQKKILALVLIGDFLKPLRMKLVPMKTTNFLRKLLWEVIEERECSGLPRGDLIDTLIKLRNNNAEIFDSDFDFDGDYLVAQAIVFVIAGLEAGLRTLTLALYELAVHPELQDRLQSEIDASLAETEGKVSYDMAKSLRYLDMVISEVLRKYPALPEINRVTKEDYKIPDSTIVLRKGTPVFISLLGLHHDPKYFPHPEKFDPERFSEINKKSILPYSYMPFGGGPHSCIGNRFALVQIKIALIKLLSRYGFSVSSKTMKPMDRVYLKVKKLL